MTVFTAPVSADDRIISSLADALKTTKKVKDISLLRELKDFSAPAKDIEKELSDLYQGLDMISERKNKIKPS
jgi:cell division protein FtsB